MLTKVSGVRCVRVATAAIQVTEDRAEAEQKADLTVIGTYAAQRAAKYAKEGKSFLLFHPSPSHSSPNSHIVQVNTNVHRWRRVQPSASLNATTSTRATLRRCVLGHRMWRSWINNSASMASSPFAPLLFVSLLSLRPSPPFFLSSSPLVIC